jgi:hypothetical protein
MNFPIAFLMELHRVIANFANFFLQNLQRKMFRFKRLKIEDFDLKIVLKIDPSV